MSVNHSFELMLFYLLLADIINFIAHIVSSCSHYTFIFKNSTTRNFFLVLLGLQSNQVTLPIQEKTNSTNIKNMSIALYVSLTVCMYELALCECVAGCASANIFNFGIGCVILFSITNLHNWKYFNLVTTEQKYV